ncbi:hypothetical protein AO382_0462 [Moraxella catarrhalis]|uniref:Uncharacterized protein n=1 Tax=Moraxella catarrhalis TaxID=480 RepID=A0A7Z0V0F8_MORCA|nr:hypothetical protein AO382_0462 [Moraxella catarrhalis]
MSKFWIGCGHRIFPIKIYLILRQSRQKLNHFLPIQAFLPILNRPFYTQNQINMVINQITVDNRQNYC